MRRIPRIDAIGECPGCGCQWLNRSIGDTVECSDCGQVELVSPWELLGENCPLCLDLFCGVGGVGRSIQAYGYRPFWDVVGIDSDGSKAEKYPGYFIEHDLSQGLPERVKSLEFDLAWASPPCQFATGLQFRRSGENLISLARELLEHVDAEITVIENVPGAREHLNDPVMFCGSAFDLGVQKHRVFETSFPAHSTPCDHPERFPFCIGEREHPVEEYRAAHGFRPHADLGAKQVRECIPPAYVHELIDQYTASCGSAKPRRTGQQSLAVY